MALQLPKRRHDVAGDVRNTRFKEIGSTSRDLAEKEFPSHIIETIQRFIECVEGKRSGLAVEHVKIEIGRANLSRIKIRSGSGE